ncbi:TIGR03749 family integrating conjugative element protein [Enterobacter wuhouensis]|uniref:TIGR03749 family integrating conjugative element protein n=1 Tax=Enterobacter wuhouensis TaxID=2529381 RepID=UPI0035254BEA
MTYIFYALLFSLPVFATEVVQWENIPLPVTLHVGQERIIDVGKPVRIGYPATLEGKVRLQSAGSKVFLLANTAFPATRIQLRDTGSGELILLDIQAIQSTSPLEPVQISYAPQAPATAKTSVPVTASTEPLPALLVRYAAQNLYAPLRTVEALPGVTPAPVRLAKRISAATGSGCRRTGQAGQRMDGHGSLRCIAARYEKNRRGYGDLPT